MRTNGEYRRLLRLPSVADDTGTRVNKKHCRASLTKVSVELLLPPVTLIGWLWLKNLKKVENVDYFDRATNFNPLKILE